MTTRPMPTIDDTRRGLNSGWWEDYRSRHPLMAEIRLMADWSDAWGECLGWHFAVAETLSAMDEEIPTRWDYHPGAFDPGTLDERADSDGDDIPYGDRVCAEAIRDGWCDAEELRYVGNVMHFYAGMLRRAGMDY